MGEMAGESGARGMNMEEAEEERDALDAEIAANDTFLSEAAATFEAAKTAYEARQATRSQEQAAISEAISILRSDDARDTFKSSYNSQTEFLQLSVNHQKAVEQVRATLMSH